MPKTYLSYSWKSDSLLIANTIDSDWQAVGLTLIRDKRDVGYKMSLREFMQSMSEGDYVLVIISKGYLESENCMYEALELFKHPDFKDKMLPIIAPDSGIYTIEGQVKYIKYWDNKIIESNKQIKRINNLTHIKNIFEKLEHYQRIRELINDFISALADMRAATWPDIKEQNYEEVFKCIGYNEQDSTILKECNRIVDLTNEEAREIELDILKTKYPGNRNILFTEATVAYESKKYDKAKYYLLKLIDTNPESWSARSNLAILLLEHFNDLKGAEEQIEAIIKQKPDNIEAQYSGAIFFKEKAGNNVRAQEILEHILKIDPNHFYSINILTDILGNTGKKEEARLLLENFLSNEPFHATAHANLAFLLSEDFDEQDDSKQHFEESLRIEPNDLSANSNYAVLLSRHFKDNEGAAHYFKQALSLIKELDSSAAYFYANYGVFIIEHLQDYKTARDYIERALEIMPNHPMAHSNLARLLSKHLGNYESAKTHFEVHLKINPNDIHVNHELALLLIRHFSDYEGAKRHFESILKLEPDNAQAHSNIGLLLIKYLGDPIQAQIHYNKACELNSKYKNPATDALFAI